MTSIDFSDEEMELAIRAMSDFEIETRSVIASMREETDRSRYEQTHQMALSLLNRLCAVAVNGGSK